MVQGRSTDYYRIDVLLHDLTASFFHDGSVAILAQASLPAIMSEDEDEATSPQSGKSRLKHEHATKRASWEAKIIDRLFQRDSKQHEIEQPKTEGGAHTGLLEVLLPSYGIHSRADREKEMQEIDEMEHFSALRKRCLMLVVSTRFQIFIGCVIAGNAVIIGMDIDDVGPKEFRYACEVLCTSAFLVEMCLRLYASTHRMRRQADLWFDFFVTAAAVFDVLFQAVMMNSASENLQDFSRQLSVVTALRLFRFVRVSRLFRMVSVIRPVRIMIDTMVACGLALIWLSLILFGIIFTVSLCFFSQCRAITEESSTKSWSAAGAVITKYFDNLGLTMLTTFETFLGGLEAAKDIAFPLSWGENPFIGIAWFLMMCVSNVAIMNLITAAFIQKLLETATRSDNEVRRRIRDSNEAAVAKIFDTVAGLDKDHDGRVSKTELMSSIRDDPEFEETIGVTKEALEDIFDIMDPDVVVHAASKGERKLAILQQEHIRTANFEKETEEARTVSVETEATISAVAAEDKAISVDDFACMILKKKCGSMSIEMMVFDYKLGKISRAINSFPALYESLVEKLKSTTRTSDASMRPLLLAYMDTIRNFPQQQEYLAKTERIWDSAFGDYLDAVGDGDKSHSTLGVPHIDRLQENHRIGEETKSLAKVLSDATAKARWHADKVRTATRTLEETISRKRGQS